MKRRRKILAESSRIARLTTPSSTKSSLRGYIRRRKMDRALNKDEALNKTDGALNKDEALNKYDASWHAEEVARGDRFEFGKNWSRFLEGFRDEQVVTAESSLKRMLEIDSLAGMRFLDIGSGSGLFSLAARRLGARVHSFDY